MSEQFEMLFNGTPGYQASKLNTVHTSVHNSVGVDSLQCVVQSDVDLNRQTEIIEGWRQLWNLMRDTNQLSSASGPIYLARNIDAPNNGARQLVDLAGVETTDIVIGVGANINLIEENGTQMIESGFQMLREFALENFFKGR